MIGGEYLRDRTAAGPGQQDDRLGFVQRRQQGGEFVGFALGAAVAVGGIAPGDAGAVVGADAGMGRQHFLEWLPAEGRAQPAVFQPDCRAAGAHFDDVHGASIDGGYLAQWLAEVEEVRWVEAGHVIARVRPGPRSIRLKGSATGLSPTKSIYSAGLDWNCQEFAEISPHPRPLTRHLYDGHPTSQGGGAESVRTCSAGARNTSFDGRYRNNCAFIGHETTNSGQAL